MDKSYNSPPKVAQRGRGNGQTRYEKEVAASGGKVDTHGDPPSLGPWVLGDTIGKGSSGRVRLARHNQTGKLAAVKIIPKNIMFSSRMSISNASAKHEKLMLGIRREIVIMKLIDHPNIMSLYDVFEADNELYLLLEYIEGGELFDFLVSKGRLAPPEALKYFREIIYGVDYCHRFNIAHRDLKPENLLLDSHKNIKIADFGMAAMEIANGMLETSCGSPHYASPEIVAGKAYHGSASDIWSCGVVLFALLVGRLPFDDPNMRVLLQKVRAGRFEIPSYIPADAKDLLRKMLVVDPEYRITMPDIIKHPFFCNPSVPRPRTIVEPPSLDEIARTIPAENDIDAVCLANLTILWHGTSEKKIVNALTCAEVNWEKAYYFLLAKYQQKVMEEYGEGYSFGFQSGRWSPPAYLIRDQIAENERRREEKVARQAARDAAAAFHRPRRETDPLDLRLPTTPGATRRHARPSFAASPERGPGLPHIVATREAPPTPSPTKRSAGRSHSRPRPSSIISGPRPPVVQNPTASSAASAAPASNEERDRRRMPPPPSPARRSTAPTRTGSSEHRPSASSQAPPVPAAAAPSSASTTARAMESTNAEIVRARFGFGNPERAEAFAAATSASNAGSGGPGSSVAPPLGKTDSSGGRHAPPPAPSPQGLGLNFPTSGEHASGGPPPSPRSTRSSTLPAGSASGTPPAIQAPLVDNPDLQKFFIEVAGVINTLSSPGSTAPNTPATNGSLFAQQAYGGAPMRANSSTGSEGYAESSTPSKRMQQQQQQQSQPLSRRASDKENSDGDDGYVYVSSATGKESSGFSGQTPGRKHRPAPLELTSNNRSSVFGSSQPSPIPSPLLTGSDFPKGQGWFTSLFNFKPASYSLFSSANAVATRRECARLLESFGVNVALEEGGEGHGVLKCHAEKFLDMTGALHSKSVRFRVQFQLGSNRGSVPNTPSLQVYPHSPLLSPPSNSMGKYVCQFTLVQERGARSSLDAIAQRLRHEWNPEVLNSPMASPMLEPRPELAA
ncbi:hypothetical protein FRC04_010600 [Tulasnella sp. 424]|nr:hypothetical protein FRC04_010600 [Tulasnella sp. 424]KAG8972336.1 hypothetical protein FRC05_010178 [Tulasnella sp. 425]